MGRLIELPADLVEYIEEKVVTGEDYGDDERATRAFWYLVAQERRHKERVKALEAQKERLTEAAREVIYAPNSTSRVEAINNLKTVFITLGI
ncbi:hypothetical protein D3C85_924540 [compost metagenome]